MRKVLSFVLVLSLVLGSFGMAFAASPKETPSDVAETEFETPVEVLMALDVVTGYPDGTYKPEGAVTRAEMAALIVRILGLGDSAGFVGKSSFGDMSGHWADKYVGVIGGKKIVEGYPDGTFKPEREVSFPEALAMISRALGYVEGCEDLTGDWPYNYLSLTKGLGITDNVDVAETDFANRGAVATMLFNSLTAANVTVDNDGRVDEKLVTNKYSDNDKDDAEYVTFLTLLDCYLQEEYVVSVDDAQDEDIAYIDLEEHVYANLDVYRIDEDDDNEVDDDDPIIAIDDINSDIVIGEFDKDDYNDDEIEDVNGDTFDISEITTKTAVFLNGGEVKLGDKDIVDLLDGFNITIYGEFEKNDDDVFDEVDGIVAMAPTDAYQVEDGDLEDIKEALEDGEGEIFSAELPTINNKAEKLDMDNIIVKGAVDKLQDIKEDDVVTVYVSGNALNDDDEYDKVTFAVARESKEIKVKKLKEDELYDTDGNEYKLSSEEFFFGHDGVEMSDFEINDVYTVQLDEFGYIYGNEEIQSTPDLFGIVVKVYGTNGGGSVNSGEPELKLFDNSGDVVRHDVTDDVNTKDLDLINEENDDEWDSVGVAKAGLEIGAVVKYSLDSNDNIDELEVVIKNKKGGELDGSYSEKTNKLDKKELESDVVIFDVSKNVTDGIVGKNDEKWDTMKHLDDDEDYVARYYKDKDDVEVLLVIEAATSNDFFAVNDVARVEEDGDDKYEVEGFLEGIAATRTTKNLKDSPFDHDSETAFVYHVEYEGGEISDATMVRTGASIPNFGHGIIKDRDSGGLDITDGVVNGKVSNGYVGDYSDDVVVYLVDFEDEEPDGIKVGKTRNIDEDDLVFFGLDDEDDEIEMVVVIDENDIEDYNTYMKDVK